MLSNYQLSDLLLDQSQAFVHLTLNRPSALNALTLEMTRVLSMIMTQAKRDANVKGVFISGAGNRAFCAGGDIKSLYQQGMAYRRGEIAENVASVFFNEEYQLNRQIKTLGKPYVAFLNGITMGGGYGVSGHGSHIIATEKTVFAMPEVRIGFFPDIGSTYNFAACEGAIGLYLALTGTSIDAADMYYAGLCGFISRTDKSERIQALLTDVVKKSSPENMMDNVTDALSHVHVAPKQAGWIERNRERIEACFSRSSVGEIIEAVRMDTSEWGKRTLEELTFASPTSLAVTFEQMKHVKAGMTFDAVMAQDLILACRFIQGHDLFEGIKAAVLDKTKSPRWSPAANDEIRAVDIARYFEPLSQSY